MQDQSKQLGTFASVKSIAADLGISEPTVWRMAKQPGFPAPVRIGNRSTRFNVSAVREWVAGRNVVESKRQRVNGRIVKSVAQ